MFSGEKRRKHRAERKIKSEVIDRKERYVS
jgi:hypothetical protein